MVRPKHLLCAAAVVVSLAIYPSGSTLAQQQPAANSTVPQPGAPFPSPQNSNIEKASSQNATPVTPDKNANDRLPFMADHEHESQQAPPSTAGLLLRTLGALLLIVGLIVVAAWSMKRFGGARFGAPKEDAPELAILNSVALGDRRSVAIVRFGERTLLLGSTPQAITLLAEADSEDIAPRVQSVADILKEETSQPFAGELNSAASRLPQAVWKADEGVQW